MKTLYITRKATTTMRAMLAFFIVSLMLITTSSCRGQNTTRRGVTTVSFAATDTVDLVKVTYGNPVVPVQINGHDALFALDTGAPASMISEEFARQIGVANQARLSLGQKSPTPDRPLILDNLELRTGAALITGSAFMVNDNILTSFARGHIDGVIGENTLSNLAIIISLQLNTLTLFAPGNISRTDLMSYGFGDAAAIPLQVLSNRHLTADVSLKQGNVTVTEPLVIDVGASDTIVSENAFKQLKAKVSYSETSTTIWKKYNAKTFSIDQLTIGAVVVNNPTVMYLQKNDGSFPSVLGRDVFAKYHVLIDFPGLKMYLLPNEVAIPYQRTRMLPITP